MEKEEIIREYFNRVSKNYFEVFWAQRAKEGGLTIKKEDGTEFLVDPMKIRCIDLGQMIGNCRCGHVIRYEFWFDDYGPIGSTCIQILTGLDGRDVNKIIQGYQYAKKDTDRFKESLRIESMLDAQLRRFPYIKELIDFVKERNLISDNVEFLIKNNISLPPREVTALEKIKRKIQTSSDIITRYGQSVYDLYTKVDEFENNFGKVIEEYSNMLSNNPNNGATIVKTIVDIGRKMNTGMATDKAVAYFKKLCEKISDPRFMEAIDVLFRLRIQDLGEFWNNVVQEKCIQSIKYGLTKNEIDFVLEKTSTGKPGLRIRFAEKLMDLSNIEKEEGENAQVISKNENEMDVDLDFLGE